MKLSIFATLATLSSVAAFAPTTQGPQSTALNMDRKAFIAAAGASIFAAVPLVANAGTMGQERINDPTEVWETGEPTATARAARTARYANARTQMTSAFPPQKRLNLERKSPVTRLDINAPNFTQYKKTYPGLYK
mmetsp:Transcript_29764/g.63121  ORF Transcript_29764/g.63121 Transcript_29764/m.63121 type:complete len:135 (-) Transcript_29764:301-705(-)